MQGWTLSSIVIYGTSLGRVVSVVDEAGMSFYTRL
jgi:hypothetical protein